MSKSQNTSARQSQSSPYLQVSLIDEGILIDVMSLLYQSRRQGALTIYSDIYHSTLYFQNGSVIYAQSNVPHHRLGSILVAQGSVKEHQIQWLVTQGSNHGLNGRLGEMLLQKGWANQSQISNALKHQAILVIEFALSQHPQKADIAEFNINHIPLNFNIDGQNLVLEGLRRLDEVNYLLKRLPPLNSYVLAQPPPSQSIPTQEYTALLSRCDGFTPLKTLIFENPLSSLYVVKALLKAIEQEWVICSAHPMGSPLPSPFGSSESLPALTPSELVQTDWSEVIETPPIFSMSSSSSPER